MGWRAETDHGQFAINTVLAVYNEPWGTGLPVPSLPPGADILLRFPNNAPTTIKVETTDDNEAIVSTTDKTKWKMKRVAATELRFPPPGTADAPTTYWLVTELLKEKSDGEV